MNSSEYNEDHLPDVLPLYYKRIFPSRLFFRWLSYGNVVTFPKREISFTLIGDVYIRFQSFDTLEEFMNDLSKRFPVKIDIGAIYLTKPKNRAVSTLLTAVEKEIVFDIDMTDYDDIRTCCSGADVCSKCWKFMVIASKIIDSGIRADFGFEHILWVFSGRRGIHGWVCDSKARELDDNARAAIAEYFQVVKGGANVARKVYLPGDKIHPSLIRALSIIDKYFMEHIVKEQDILGNEERMSCFLNAIDEDHRGFFRDAMKKVKTSSERWTAFENTFSELSQKGQIPRNLKNLKEEMKLYYSYPRLDINVTKGINHLLKAPFCVHPKTGKICVPFNVKLVDNFDPHNVPTVTVLVDEINSYDKKTKEQEESLMETDESSIINRTKIKDYKKTSLLKATTVFEEFLRSLERSAKKEDAKNQSEIM